MSVADLTGSIAGEDAPVKDARVVAKELERRAKEESKSSEVMHLFENASHKEVYEISDGLTQKAFREAGIDNLGHAQMISDETEFLDLSKEKSPSGDAETPQIWFKQVTKGRKKMNQAVVITRDRNSDSGHYKDSVVNLALVPHKDGVPNFEHGWRYTVTQEKYQEIITKDPSELDSRMDRLLKRMVDGKTSIQEMRKVFPKIMGSSYKKYWRDHDRKLADRPERWVLKDEMGARIDSLLNGYSEQLQYANNRVNEIIASQEAAETARLATIEQLWGHPANQELLRQYKEANDSGDNEQATFLKSILGSLGITDETLPSLLEKLT